MKKFAENLEVPYGDVFEKFDKHLRLPHNNHLIFSGAYGIGKTTFLKGYFKEYEKDFFLVRISPVHYSVNSNQEIFDLIKADIIRQLYFSNVLKFEEEEKLDKYVVGLNFVKKNPIFLAKSIAKAFGRLSPDLALSSAVISATYEIIEKFKEFDNEINSEYIKNTNSELKYLESIESEFGSYLEFNIITQMIVERLEGVKKSKGRKKRRQTVLLIDDLDRIDPEHIFRILNVFASHNDLETTENKFGFEKVIISCDFKNIANLFHHIYGDNADFNGYMEKFYSDEIFRFSNIDGLNYFLENVFESSLSSAGNFVLKELLRNFVENDTLKIRQIVKYSHFQPHSKIKLLETELDSRIINWRYTNTGSHLEKYNFYLLLEECEFISIIKYLSMVFGDYENLKRAFAIQPGQEKTYSDFDNVLAMVKICGFIKLFEQAYNRRSELMYIESLGDLLHSDSLKENRPNLNIPKFHFDGVEMEPILKWSRQKPYNAEISFYSDFNLRLKQYSNKTVKFSAMYQMFRNTIENLDNKLKLLVGISS